MRKKTFKKWLNEFYDEQGPTVYAVYVFVRKDIPIFAQAVQVGHACLGVGELCHDRFPENLPQLILLKVENERELLEAKRISDATGAHSYMFYETDRESLGGEVPSYTAFATEPLPKEKWARFFADYDLWEVR